MLLSNQSWGQDTITKSAYKDKVLGGWLGKCIGVYYSPEGRPDLRVGEGKVLFTWKNPEINITLPVEEYGDFLFRPYTRNTLGLVGVGQDDIELAIRAIKAIENKRSDKHTTVDGLPVLYSYAFKEGKRRGLILVSLDTAKSHDVELTFPGRVAGGKARLR